jgi:hypothetical protein
MPVFTQKTTEETSVHFTEDERRYVVLKCATPTQFRQIWDRMLQGENFDALVDELGRIQEEYDTRKERAA